MLGHRADWLALAAAAGLHAAALALLARLDVTEPHPARRSVEVNEPLVDIELELESFVRATGAPAVSATVPSTTGGAVTMRSPAAFGRSRSGTTVVPLAVDSIEAQVAERSQATARGTAPMPRSTPRLSLEQLGVGGPVGYPLVRPPVSTTRRAAAERRLRRVLQEPVVQRDTELGTGPHGPVVLALEAATHRLATPLNGNALFLVRLDAQGRLVELSVLEASEDRPAWVRVATRAQQVLESRQLRPSNGARGLALRIAVDSREQLPSGADPGFGVSIAGIPIKRGRGPRSPQLDILKPELRIENEEVPNPGGGEPIKLPALRLGFNVLGGGIDPADLGKKPRRVVHAHVVGVEID